MCAVIEKEIAVIMHEIVIVDAQIYNCYNEFLKEEFENFFFFLVLSQPSSDELWN